MANQTNLTAQQRAMLFGANTRQHFQMLGKQTVNGGAQTITFNIPKVRLLQSIRLLVNAKVTTDKKAEMNDTLYPYRLIRRVSVDFNNGFSPIVISGRNAAMLNMLRLSPKVIEYSGGDTLCYGAYDLNSDPYINFMLELPLTLNERDPVGLILAQSQETNITVQIDIANDSVFTECCTSDATFTIDSVSVTPEVTTFSIPSSPDAFPDMSVLRVVAEQNETFTAGGASSIKLQTGMIYRKILLYFTDEEGKPLTSDDITSNIELVLNSADIPYSISPEMLKQMNISQNGYKLPDGLYAFDFSNQGIPSLGGSRDYLDSERVTEFTLRFTAAKAGKLTVISEKLSRLIG